MVTPSDAAFNEGVALAKSLIIEAIPPGTQARVAAVAGAFLMVATLIQIGARKEVALSIVGDIWDGIVAAQVPQ